MQSGRNDFDHRRPLLPKPRRHRQSGRIALSAGSRLRRTLRVGRIPFLLSNKKQTKLRFDPFTELSPFRGWGTRPSRSDARGSWLFTRTSVLDSAMPQASNAQPAEPTSLRLTNCFNQLSPEQVPDAEVVRKNKPRALGLTGDYGPDFLAVSMSTTGGGESLWIKNRPENRR